MACRALRILRGRDAAVMQTPYGHSVRSDKTMTVSIS